MDHLTFSHTMGYSHGTSHCLGSKARDGGKRKFSYVCCELYHIHDDFLYKHGLQGIPTPFFFYVEVGFRGLWLKGLLIVILIKISGIEGHCNTYEKMDNTLKYVEA